MNFRKENLLRDNYSWSNEGSTEFSKNSSPSRKLFDRCSGDCVLSMINMFDSLVAALTVADGQRIETLLLNELPFDVRSEMSVFNWLKEKYLYAWS